MADDGGAGRPPQAYATVSPAGVGTTSNLVFPATLIDEEWDQRDVEDMTRYLESHFTTIP